jgi:Family of unknown function (DUF695)/Regulator of ribonuclease activity B
MSDDWDFWVCQIDDKPVSIFVDLGIDPTVPISGYRKLGCVRLQMNEPRQDGLSSAEELSNLVEIEDLLCARICADRACVFVGRSTSQTRRVFYFYHNEAIDFTAAVSREMGGFPDYRFHVEIRDDPQWTLYRELLYPPLDDLQRILNRRVCDQLRKNRDELLRPRVIDHCAYFSKTSAREEFIKHVLEAGFELRIDDLWNDPHGRFRVEFSRSDIPNQIDAVTIPLFHKIQELSGEYDGWGCEVVGGEDSSV